MKVIALDPGGTTGWASLRDDYYEHGQIGPEPHHVELWNLLITGGWDVVVCERFEYRNTSRAGLEIVSREYIGVATLWCEIHRRPMVKQNASQAKGFVKDKNLERLGALVKADNHGMDAYRHLFYYLINTSTIDSATKENLLKVGWTS